MAWTQLDAAHVLIAIDDIPAIDGPAMLTIQVSASHQARGAFETLLPLGDDWPLAGGPLDGARLRLTKATLF